MEGKLNGLDLFSGIGGISLALAPWVKTIAYCEKDPYAQQVLLSRMAEGWIDLAPVWQTVDWINHARAKVLP
jgi:site-specific DNA-cytosine methylase